MMSMATQIHAAGGRWVDFGSTGHPPEWYAALRARGYTGVVLDAMTGGWQADYGHALAAGLQVMIFQGYYAPAWTGGATGGAQRADALLREVRTVDYPAHGQLWLDSEDWGSIPAPEAIAWMNAWFTAVRQAGYTDGIYVGANTPLTGDQLYTDLITAHYWRSASAVPPVTRRGYQMVQTPGATVLGVPVDEDLIQADALGGLPLAVVPILPSAPDPMTVQVTTLTHAVGDLKAAVADLTARVGTAVTRPELAQALQQIAQEVGKGA